MSFGFGVGDFLAVGKLCWSVYKKCKDSPGNYKELSGEVGALHNVMKETEELLSQQRLSPEQKERLKVAKTGCEDVLGDLDAMLIKYESLGTKSQRTFNRMGFGLQDMASIRLRLISNVSLLDAFNNASSHARLEGKLNLLIAEIRSGKREGSVVSSKTFDSMARDDRETWETLRRELEDIGISPTIITEKRQFIVAWFQEAVAAGKLEEDTPDQTDDDDEETYERNILLPTQDEPENDTDSDGPEIITEYLQENREVDPPTRDAQKPPKKEPSRLSVSYLLGKLQSKDRQLLRAAGVGDVRTAKILLGKGASTSAKTVLGGFPLYRAVAKRHQETVLLLLDNGADVNAKNSNGRTALHEATSQADKTMIRLLLDHGADVNAKNKIGRTVLHEATSHADQSMIRLLLKNGADINAHLFT